MGPALNLNAAFQLLSELSLRPTPASGSRASGRTSELLSNLGQAEFKDLKALATANHVILRSFEPLHRILAADGKSQAAEWVSAAMKDEAARIHHAVGFLEQICSVLEEGGCPVTVIKSLDHWPDLGSDLDLYMDARPERLIEIMRLRFNASLSDRSWGDRLANKWNFVIPGLSELVEVHVGRLGQTGEQTEVTRSLSDRTQTTEVGGHTFRVAAPEDRIVISTLQRMYRHFYIRLCDVVDNAGLLDAKLVDFAYLETLGATAGIWEGIANYMKIISDYVESYRGFGVPLPLSVEETATFGADQISFRKDFLRVPILPHSLHLYASELRTLMLKGDLRNGLRLSLLPGLATAAAIEQKITGSDKGIW